MIVLMKLLTHRLEFIPYGNRGRIHARRNGVSSSTPAYDLSTITVCKRDVPQGAQAMSERAVNVQKLCQNCYSALQTYGPTQVQLVDENEGEGIST